jgi:hypothetical protein
MKKVILSLVVFASAYSLQANNSISKPITIEDDCLVCSGTGTAQICGYGATCSEALRVLKAMR